MKAGLALVLAMTGVARAAPDDDVSRFTLQVGAGARAWHDRSRHNDLTFDVTPEAGEAGSIQVMGGVRVSHGLSLGVRLVTAWERYVIPSNVNFDLEQFTVVPFDMAASALFDTDIFWVSPWIGWHTLRTQGTEKRCVDFVCEHDPMLDIAGHWNTGGLGFGWLVGLDLMHHDHDRFGMYLDVQGSSSFYFALGVGLAYRRR
jgi:hypothetical protein